MEWRPGQHRRTKDGTHMPPWSASIQSNSMFQVLEFTYFKVAPALSFWMRCRHVQGAEAPPQMAMPLLSKIFKNIHKTTSKRIFNKSSKVLRFWHKIRIRDINKSPHAKYELRSASSRRLNAQNTLHFLHFSFSVTCFLIVRCCFNVCPAYFACKSL